MKDLEKGEGVERQLDESTIEALSAELAEAVAEQAEPSTEIELSFDEKEKELEDEASIQPEPIAEVASTDLSGLILSSEQSSGETATGGALTNQDMALFVGASLLTAGAIAVALDDDDDNKNNGGQNPDPNAYTLTVDSPSVAEGSSGTADLTFTLTLDRPAEDAVVVDYSTGGGTATAGEDYDATTGSVTFAVGETTKTITIPVSGDTDVEENETVNVDFSGDDLEDDVTAIGTITNDDQEPGDFTPVTVSNDGTPIIGDDEIAEAFELIFGDDGASGSAFNFAIENFDVAADRLVLTGIEGLAGATLADLVGDSGLGNQPITVDYNPFDDELFVTMGQDADGDVSSFTLAGISDASLVTLGTAAGDNGGGDNGGGDNGGGDNGGGDNGGGEATDVTVDPGTAVAGTDAAESFQLGVGDDGVAGSAFEFTITDFVTADDKIVFSGISGADGSTLADLIGDPGLGNQPITADFNPFDNEMFVTLGQDGDGDVATLVLPGISDAAMVNIEIV